MEVQDIITKMESSKVIPLYYEADPKIACDLMMSCHRGGAELIEFTNRGANALAVFEQMVAYKNEHCPSMVLGVGSIANIEQAEAFLALGADFLVSPFIDESLAKFCQEKGVFWTGGCATLTEMHNAYSWGVPLMKAFPGNILGPSFISAAKAPCPYFKIMPTGGVRPEQENLEAWFKAGATCVGMGSKLFVKNEDGSYDHQQIQWLLELSIKIAKNY